MTTIPDILVIEDDSIMREALTDWLQEAGYGVRAAPDGGAGLAAVKLTVPGVVITDIHMPGMSGTAVIAELNRNYPQVPIIAISGLFNSGHSLDAAGALALGAYGPYYYGAGYGYPGYGYPGYGYYGPRYYGYRPGYYVRGPYAYGGPYYGRGYWRGW